MTVGAQEATRSREFRFTSEALALMEKFPPREISAVWPETCRSRHDLTARLLSPPFLAGGRAAREARRLGVLKVLDWLELHPGSSWQERWEASGAGVDGSRDWRPALMAALSGPGSDNRRNDRIFSVLGSGMALLIAADVIRPALGWLLTAESPYRLSAEMERVRDPDGFARLREARRISAAGNATTGPAVEKVALIMAAKGGLASDVTVGDCLELVSASWAAFPGTTAAAAKRSPFFYQLLHTAGLLPAGAPPTVRKFSSSITGQLTPGQMIDRYDLACRPVRDLLVDYLLERQPGVDYSSLSAFAVRLGLSFWKDLETHHPGISSLRLPPDIAAAWKQRIMFKPGGEESKGGIEVLSTVRTFYLDISQWALDDPARWGPWAVPCPVRAGDVPHRKAASRRKSRMDQRTRERLPALPVLSASADRARRETAARLEAAAGASPGELFAAGGQVLRRARLKQPSPRTWAEDPQTGRRRDLTREEGNAFWAWAAIEVLRLTGIRIEELTELSHHSMVQYRVPSSGEPVPLLSVAPSKTDEERLLVIAPELADVLSAVICRIREPGGNVPLVDAYDCKERTWNPPMPLLFQRRIGLESRPITTSGIRGLLDRALAEAGLARADGSPLRFTPHDFRRIFATEAIMNGMPPHIAQLIMGHRDISTTMGYKAVYPQEAINGHRAFLARRRQLRPSEEYRTPTDAEWDEFLGHFERRKVALGDCGRAYGTSCIHEHSCVRCPLLRISPAQRGRLEEIRDNLMTRIAEAEREGWAGEAEGLRVSLAAANNKLAQADNAAARRSEAVDLGIPAYRDVAAATIAATGDCHDR